MKNKTQSKVWGKIERGEPRAKKYTKGFYIDTDFSLAIKALLKPKDKPSE